MSTIISVFLQVDNG